MLISDKCDCEVTTCIVTHVSPIHVSAQSSRLGRLPRTVGVERVGALVAAGLMLCVTSLVAGASSAPGIDLADRWPISTSEQQTLEMMTAVAWVRHGPGMGSLRRRRRRTRPSHPPERSRDINSAFLDHYRCPEQ